MKEVRLKVFGTKAAEIARRLGLRRNGEITDMNTKITFTYGSVEGYPNIEVEFEV